MAGERQGQLRDIELAPGILTNEADRDARGRYKACNRIRFSQGRPEKMGGSERVNLVNSAGALTTFIGTCRALHDWSTLDSKKWIGLATHKKLYITSTLRLYDITPIRRKVSRTNPFTTTNGSPLVVVADNSHRAEPGEYVRFFDASAVGGLTISGEYEVISVVTPDSYSIQAASNASSSATGGGVVLMEYDIHSGLEENGELTGYGTGNYGEGTYGTPRAAGTGFNARMRIWSLDNWGEDLMANFGGGGIYWWDRSTGPNARAKLIDTAPPDVRWIIVNPENGFLIALGASDLQGNPDPMRVAWCEQGDFQVWLSIANVNNPDIASAGGKRLDYGSEIITGLKTRSGNLIWTDVWLYWMEFLPGDPNVFGFRPLGSCKIVGPNAATDANGAAYFMGFDDFYIYDGTLRPLDCEIWSEVFGAGSFDRTQAEKVYCSKNENQSEVIWFYPTSNGVRYACYNYAENIWYGGIWERTAFRGLTKALTGAMTNPYATNAGKLYLHEIGTDEVDGATTTPPAWFLETWDITALGSDQHALINNVVPNFDRMTGFMQMRLKGKNYPQQPTYTVNGPHRIGNLTELVNPRIAASQIAFRWESNGGLGEDVRFGAFQWDPIPYGRRRSTGITIYASDGTPVDGGGGGGGGVDPGAVVLSGVSDGAFNELSWTASLPGSAPIAGYRLYNADTDALIADIANPLTLNYDDGPLAEGTYSYYVIAYAEDDLVSLQSNTVTLEVDLPTVFGEFVVALSTGSDAVMTSPDGINWTQRTTPDSTWAGLCYSPELHLYVAVASSSGATGSIEVMTSPDAITWTPVEAVHFTRGVAWSPELGLFAAVGFSSAIMTSPDGITWTSRTAPEAAIPYHCITWAPELGLFLAGSIDGTEYITVSSDGINWTFATDAQFSGAAVYDVEWSGAIAATASRAEFNLVSADGQTWTAHSFLSHGDLAYGAGPGLFVAVNIFGNVQTSPDGQTWTTRTPAAAISWEGVCYSEALGLYIAVATSGAIGRVMTSPDGITWTLRTGVLTKDWYAVISGQTPQ
jgi:hypothetical protein